MAETDSCGDASPIRPNLFSQSHTESMKSAYEASQPYRHLIIENLIDEKVLQAACDNLKNNIIATLKETDIYKVYQTGDMANIDGLSNDEKSLLPDLIRVRNALYSSRFRAWVAEITGVGPLSGSHIDISINAYGHTGHLLCHDDVIGSRKVSYILYLVDPTWNTKEKLDGGNLQLYPLAHPEVLGIPSFSPTVSIPPKWNQMVMFAVDPGRSFHDVQEVYNEEMPRLSISGWFHSAKEEELGGWPQQIIQQGYDHDKIFDAQVATASTLAQLEAGECNLSSLIGQDLSVPGHFKMYERDEHDDGNIDISEWINPLYLQSGTQEKCRETFESEGSTVLLHHFLKSDICANICNAVRSADKEDGLGYMESSAFDVGVRANWIPVGPPHKQRMLRLTQDLGNPGIEDDEVGALMRKLQSVFRTQSFCRFLESVTGLDLLGSRSVARRFRPGQDYTLATPLPWDCGEENLILDAVLCFVDNNEPYKEAAWMQDEVGGYQTYLTNEKSSKKDEYIDASVYKADEDGSLLSVSATCNALSLVLRDDADVLSFVKYVSAAAPGSRYDVAAEYVVDGQHNGSDENSDSGSASKKSEEKSPVQKRQKQSE